VPEIGWAFQVQKPSGVTEDLHFSTTGSYSFDVTRAVTRAISGFVLVPEEFDKVDLVRDRVNCFLVVDGVRKAMGVFRFTDSSQQVEAAKLFARGGSGTGAGPTYSNSMGYSVNYPYADTALLASEGFVARNLVNVALGDTATTLIRNDGSAETLRVGFDASQEMQRICLDAGLDFSFAGSLAPSRNDVTWDGSATQLDKVTQLAVLAGHRNPWSDNTGVMRSVPAVLVQTDVIDLQDLKPTGQSIVVTESFLTAPNRVIVVDNSSIDRGVVGQWDAPASAPHSFANLGYYRTSTQSVQGLGSVEHAQMVAQALGEAYSARKLDCQIQTTNVLDGPQVIFFSGANWLVTAWSVGTAPNSPMSISCQELNQS
jgi:hypothetical protein